MSKPLNDIDLVDADASAVPISEKNQSVTFYILTVAQATRISFYKKPVYKKPGTRYPQITPNLRNFKNYKKRRYFDLRNSLFSFFK